MGSTSIHGIYGSAEKEGDGEELGVDVAMRGEDTLVEGQDDPAIASIGRWVHSVTGLPLGGDNGTIEFTVVG